MFLCHSTADKAVVETLAKRLKSEGVKPWLDKWNLVPGEPWQPEIENALRKCRSCAVFIGPASSGPWQNEEMRAAIVRRVDNREKFRVIPVLLPKSKGRLSDNLPAFLLAATLVDFRNGVDDTEALRALICGIRGVPPGEGADSGSVNEGRTIWVMTLRASVSDVDRQVAHEILQHLAKLSGDATLTIRKITAGSVMIEFEGTKAGAEKIRSLELNGLLKEVLGFEIDSIRMIGVPVSNPAVFPADESVTPIPESAKKPSTRVQHQVQQPEHVPPPLFDADYSRTPITEQLLHARSAGDRSVPFEPDELVAGRFRVLKEVGRGGMCVVYEAHDEKLDRRVALKTAVGGHFNRLPPEARAAREVSHFNVCKVYELHSARTELGEVEFLTMEFIPGETLSARIRRTGALPPAEARDIAGQICAGLAQAHRQGVIHRDLKCGNVILTEKADGGTRAVITDFGLASFNLAEGESGANSPLRGSFDYMAPELFSGGQPGIASDLYALGVIFLEMLTGKVPTPAENPTVPEDANTRTLTGKLPKPWGRIVARCLEADPQDRFASTDEVISMLEGRPEKRRWLLARLFRRRTALS